MTAPVERWERTKQLFHDASDLPEGERRAFLEEAAADDPTLVDEVLRLLAGDGTDVPLLDRGVGAAAASMLRTPASLDPEEFLPYRLLAPIGEGGMGVVFLAERDDLEMKVAIKILRDAWLSPARRKRFVAEQRTLAHLSHPGIARIHDAHTLADGTPWFVMEFVDGMPLTDYCAKLENSIEDRLRLFRAVCEAVQYAHEHGVIHRDLKPSNILVNKQGSVRLVDFGIAKRIDGERDKEKSRTTVALMTPAYAAPEQLRGESTTPRTDIYALGVVLFELLTGRLPHAPDGRVGRSGGRTLKPSIAVRDAEPWRGAVNRRSTAAWADLDVLCMTATHEDPDRRYPTIAALIADIDHFLDRTPLVARADSLVYRATTWTRRRWPALGAAVVLIAAGAVLALSARSAASASKAPGTPVVAVMPFRNAASDSAIDFLRQAVPDELTTTLGLRRGLSVRAFSSTSGYSSDTLDLRRVGRNIGVTHIVTGEFTRSDADVAITMRLIDVRADSVVWEDHLELEPGNAIALQDQVANVAHGSLALSLGVSAPSRSDLSNTRPRNERAYQLYLRSAGGRYDPGAWNDQAIAMLEEAVALDSTYAPAWLMLSRRYYIAFRFGSGDPRLRDRMLDAADRAVKLDPEFVMAGARRAAFLIEQNRKVEAYQQLQELLRRRSDSPDVHFALSYVLRSVGMLRESARECGVTLSIDAHNFGWRSCAVASILLGDYDGALGFVNLDAGSEWAKAMTIHMLVRSGRERDALALGRPNMPQWKSYDLLLACLARRSAAEIDSLAAQVKAADDPETNYFAASHVAYCGRTTQALDLVDHAISGGYCSSPVMETDPYFAGVRADPRFDAVRLRGAACRQRFVEAVSRPMR